MSNHIRTLSLISTAAFALQGWKLLAVEVPELLRGVEADPNKIVKDFVAMYNSVAPPQIVLALISTISSGYLAFKTGNKRFLASTLLAFFPVPFTILLMAPQTNDKMIEMSKSLENSEQIDTATIEPILKKWRWMHGLRALTSTAAFSILCATGINQFQ
eukprot:gene13396-15773_t